MHDTAVYLANGALSSATCTTNKGYKLITFLCFFFFLPKINAHTHHNIAALVAGTRATKDVTLCYGVDNDADALAAGTCLEQPTAGRFV